MLARAARRKLRRDAFCTPTTTCEQLTLPRICPSQWRRTAHTSSPSISTHPQEVRRRRRPSIPQTQRHETRSLATTAELQPSPSPAPFSPFVQQLWGPRLQSPDLARLDPWDRSNPLIVRDAAVAAPPVRKSYGLGSDPMELHQNLYACLRVGRIDRAAVIIGRLAGIYRPFAPELVDAHNVYLQTLLELGQQEHEGDSMAKMEDWYNSQMLRNKVDPNAQTLVTMIRAAMSFLDEDAQEAAIQRFLAMAHELGPEMVDDINASPDFTDEEWDVLIRMQPDAYEEPPTVQEVQTLHISTPTAQKNLVEHGLLAPLAHTINPTPQKGKGLDSLKQALAMFDDADSVPYPHDMQGSQEEKDQAFAYARQLRMEQDSVQAAVERWKYENEKLQDMGIHGVLNGKPVQAVMYNWYTALVPLFKQKIERSREVLSAPLKDNARDDLQGFGAWLEACQPERLAALTIARVVQACVKGKDEDHVAMKISALSIAVGTDVQDHLRADAQARRDAFLKKQRKQTRSNLVNKLAKDKSTLNSPGPSTSTLSSPSSTPFGSFDMSLPVRTKIGALCLELLLKSARISITVEDPKTGKQLTNSMAAFHHQVGFHQGKKVGYMVAHHQLLTKLRTESVHSIQTVRLPMVTEPKPWSSFDSGGYYTSPEKVVRQKSGDMAQRAYAQSAIENGDMSQVLAALDVLGQVPWQINSSIFDVMAKAWNDGIEIGGIVNEDLKLERPVEPPADAPYKERVKWGRLIQEHENMKGGLHSQRCFQNFLLETARAFVKEPKIFFPHSVDFRGRAYPIPPILNHIGSDISRGLLKFARGKELGTVGLQWLKIHLANLYGFDKASLSEREQFAMDHISDIYDSATNPLGGQRWWAKAEDPWQCLACCMELKNAFESPDPTRYVSQLPVHQDGTCNGLQHYAALGGDHAGARQVNLEPSDKPQDIYTGVAELVKDMISKDAAEGNVFAKFVDGHITRKVVKQTVMTNVYGVTFMGAKLQIQDRLQDIFPNFKESDKIHSLAGPALYIAYKIFKALGTIFNGAQEIQYWLGECGDRITTSLSAEQIESIRERHAGKETAPYGPNYIPPKKIAAAALSKVDQAMETFKTSIIWTTPLKMPIVQPYRKDSVQKIKTKIQDITVTKRAETDAIDKRKQLQAFPPNFVHSLDATHMTLSALKCSEIGLDFAAVHDSFWTHAADIPNLNVVLRDAFVRMHSEDIIDRLAAEFSARYAGAMYRANILSSAPVAKKISLWRAQHRKDSGQTLKSTNSRMGTAPISEVALEAKRQKLLKSEDPEERKKGEEMVTPTSIWLENQDPKAFSSFRLSLLGETKDKQSRNRQEEVKDKVLSAEADAVDNPETAADSDVETASAEAETDLSAPKKKKTSSQDQTTKVWIPLTFPPVPQKGGWDVARLRESKYFFS